MANWYQRRFYGVHLTLERYLRDPRLRPQRLLERRRRVVDVIGTSRS
jgi:hypothetical protein